MKQATKKVRLLKEISTDYNIFLIKEALRFNVVVIYLMQIDDLLVIHHFTTDLNSEYVDGHSDVQLQDAHDLLFQCQLELFRPTADSIKRK